MSAHAAQASRDNLESYSAVDHARRYVARGHRVVLLHEPVGDGCSCANRNDSCPSRNGKDATGKHPRHSGWQHDLIVDASAAETAWAQHPTANVGLCPRPNEIVLDIDPRNGGDVTFARLVTANGELRGPAATTGGGGTHHWIQLPPGTDIEAVKSEINRRLEAIGPGVDLRTCHHQVVVAPSMHKSGLRYEWLPGRSVLECEPEVPSEGWLHALGILDSGNESAARSRSSKFDNNVENDLARARWGLLEARLLDPDRGYNQWFRLGPALKCFGDAGRDLWIEASRPSKDFNEAEIRRKWPGITGSSIASLFGMFDDADPTWRRRFADASGNGPSANHESPTRPSDPSVPVDGGHISLGQRDPATGRLVLSDRRTWPTADAFIREFHAHPDGRTLHGYGDSLLAWADNKYSLLENGGVRNRVHSWLHDALRYVMVRDVWELRDFPANPTTVNSAVTTIQSSAHLPLATPVPSWLGDVTGRLPAHELLPCKTLTVHIPTGDVLQPTPALFNFNALDFDYNAQAPEPTRWCAFLRELFGDDVASIRLLQEWFGYCLTADTRQQKIMLLVGPRRSGKGTIARVLTRLVGLGNVVSPTVGSLAGAFGLQPLLGRSLAIVSDARFAGDNIATVVERLFCISGEDAISVDVKFKESLTVKLPVRFVFLSNELPRFNDASTALAGRFLVLRLTKSFYGNENIDLTQELLGELPGILLWAIDGWQRLHDRGHFVEPESSRTAVQDIEDLSSPVGAFVRERCVVQPALRVSCAELYQAWCSWCTAEGRTLHTTTQTFGRDLAAAVPGVIRRRCTGRPSFYDGIGLSLGGEP